MALQYKDEHHKKVIEMDIQYILNTIEILQESIPKYEATTNARERAIVDVNTAGSLKALQELSVYDVQKYLAEQRSDYNSMMSLFKMVLKAERNDE